MNYREIFEKVWRTDQSQPGYFVVDMGSVDSFALRREMVKIKEEFSKIVPFQYSWLMRFDQQVTTKFHRDGGPPENILMLGYEPSEVKSNLYIGDYLEFSSAKEMPVDKIQQVPPFQDGHSYIVILNNSHAMGVWHKGEIPNPDASKSRVINSMQLAKGHISPIENRSMLLDGKNEVESLSNWLNVKEIL